MISQESPLPQNSSTLFDMTTDQAHQESLFHRVFYFHNPIPDIHNNYHSPNTSASISASTIPTTTTNSPQTQSTLGCLYYSISKKQLIHLASYQENQFQRGVRGGMLCDEPGLGKTVTMLAVILKSIGAMSTNQIDLDPTNDIIYSPQRMNLRSPSRRRSLVQNNLILSKTTLIVTPDSLISHWRDQINLHINPTLKLKIYLDDDLTKSLPSAQEIAQYDIFLTCFRFFIFFSFNFFFFFLLLYLLLLFTV